MPEIIFGDKIIFNVGNNRNTSRDYFLKKLTKIPYFKEILQVKSNM